MSVSNEIRRVAEIAKIDPASRIFKTEQMSTNPPASLPFAPLVAVGEWVYVLNEFMGWELGFVEYVDVSYEKYGSWHSDKWTYCYGIKQCHANGKPFGSSAKQFKDSELISSCKSGLIAFSISHVVKIYEAKKQLEINVTRNEYLEKLDKVNKRHEEIAASIGKIRANSGKKSHYKARYFSKA